MIHTLDASKDMFVITYMMEPGFSTGWIVHTDEMAIMLEGNRSPSGEARDGECKKVEEYTAGEAWAHKPHRHMGAVEGNEPAVFTRSRVQHEARRANAGLRQQPRPHRLHSGRRRRTAPGFGRSTGLRTGRR